MSEKKKDQEQLPEWLNDFDKESIKKSAEVDIKPKLTIDDIGIENGKDITILSIPYKVNIPKEKSINGKSKIFVIDLLYNNIEHQFIAESGSFRFQLGVLKEKLDLSDYSKLIGIKRKLWKQMANINTSKFTGKAEVYVLSEIN